MKLKYIILSILCGGLIFSSCKDGADYREGIFITGIESSPIKMLTVDATPSEIAFSVSASDKVAQNVDIELEVVPALVEKFNTKYKKSYQLLPEGSYQLAVTSVTIQADEFTSNPSKLTIVDVSKFEEGVSYLLPVSIKKTSGDMGILEASRTVYFLVNRTIITQVASLVGNYFKVDFKGKDDQSLKSVPQVTYEIRVYVNRFASSNPYISSLMGIEEHFLMRFGDASNVDPNQLQATQGDATSTTRFSTNKWYHVAAVFDNGRINLYVDGVLESSIPHKNVKALDLLSVHSSDKYFTFGRSYGSRGLNGYISEARVWTKALSQADIMNNMCYVSPDSEGLLAYWRFNEGTGNICTDLTGNGYDAVSSKTAIDWIAGVRCPE